jgi:hypothetical protein
LARKRRRNRGALKSLKEKAQGNKLSLLDEQNNSLKKSGIDDASLQADDVRNNSQPPTPAASAPARNPVLR